MQLAETAEMVHSPRFSTMEKLNLQNKKVMIREDFNVPIHNGVVTSDQRIRAALPSLRYALAQNAGIIVVSHLGRPTEGSYDPTLTLRPIAQCLSDLLGQKVTFVDYGAVPDAITPGTVTMLENIRFSPGECNNCDALAKQLAGLCEVFVMDAFACAHRAHASTHGVATVAKEVCAGPLLAAEINALDRLLQEAQRPVVAVVGGAKISTKLTVLTRLLEVVNVLIVGGGIANTLLAAKGYPIGQSIAEPSLYPAALELLEASAVAGVTIPLPVDLRCGKRFAANAVAEEKRPATVEADDLILDIGSRTMDVYRNWLQKAQTIIWNGPVGVFEFPPFAEGTQSIAQAIQQSNAYSVAGGGDTLAAVEQFSIADDLSYISTGGGAFLEFLEGKSLPAIAILEQRYDNGQA